MSDDNSYQDTEESDPCPVYKRTHHNMLERQRRDNIKDSFTSLREALPAFKDEKVRASRAQILKKAVEFIRTTRQRNEAHQTDIVDLRKENELLEDQIRMLQNAVASGQVVEDSRPKISSRQFGNELHDTSSSSTDSSDSTDAVNSFQPQRKRSKARPVSRKPVKRSKPNAKR